MTSLAGSKATLEDVARMAGVSLATVDRVVNRRVGVRERTIARVEAAVVKLGYRADAAATRLARNRSFRFAFILPTGANTFMTNLAEQVRRTADWLAGHRGFIDVLHVDVFDPDALAGALAALSPDYHGVATIALDHPRVRGAIDDLAARGVAVVTLVSDAPSARRLHYVGIDNPAVRDHAERQFGFNQILSEYPDLVALPALEGRDDSTRTQALTATLLAQRPDLVGIYSVGAGNRGIAAALEASGRGRDVVWIAHELTVHTRDFLLRGVIDAVINQNPGHEARSAARVLLAHCWGDPILADQERINIDIFLRDNLP